MRLLIYPTYEFLSHCEGDSSFILTRALAKQLGQKKDIFCYWVTPDIAPVEENPVGYLQIKEKISGSRDYNEVTPFKCIHDFNPIDGKYPIDAVISNNAGKLWEYINYHSLMNMKRDVVNYYTWDFSTKFIGACEISNIDDRNLASHALAYVFAKRNFFFSEFSRRKGRDDVVRYCSPYLIDKFDRNSEVIPIAFDCEELAKNTVAKDEKFSFYFGGRFTATKGGEKILSQYDYLYSYGRDIKIKVATPNAGTRRLTKFLSKRGQEIEVYEKLTTKEYQAIMSSCHVSIYHQSLKMFPAAPFEQMYAGLVVLFKDYGYEREILPPNYPFLYKDDNEAATMVRYVYENYEEAKARVAYVKEWIENTVDRKKGMERMANEMREDAVRVYKPRDFTRELFTEDKISHEQLREKINAIARNKNLIWFNPTKANKAGLMNSELYKKNIPLDYVDNCELELPYYEKR